MNNASQDFPYHLGVLRERMLHPTDMAMIIPGVRGEGDLSRFHLTGGLTDPQKN